MDRGAQWATVHGVTESDMTERLSTHTQQITPSRKKTFRELEERLIEGIQIEAREVKKGQTLQKRAQETCGKQCDGQNHSRGLQTEDGGKEWSNI